MAKYYALYNPLSCNGKGEEGAKKLTQYFSEEELVFKSLLDTQDMAAFFASITPEDKVILCGGDGTINRFINDAASVKYENEILYFPVGTGNDFAFDMGFQRECKPFAINQYIQNLPTVEVNGKKSLFLNGIGYGIDGYCCEEGDRMKEAGVKDINYAGIAIKGLLFHYKPTNAKLTVDGVTQEVKKVWLAPTMHGRFYGGGMMPTPAQVRNGDKLSLMVFHGSGKLHTLMIFPSIFKGEHVNHTKQISVFTGKEITVEFDRPTPLQIDGETVLNVTSYTVYAPKGAEQKEEAAAATV